MLLKFVVKNKFKVDNILGKSDWILVTSSSTHVSLRRLF